MTMNPIDK